MGFVDKEGLEHFWDNAKEYIGPSAKVLSQIEYDSLNEEEKRDGTLYITPGTSAKDENSPVPTGAIISFLAMVAPHGYLICDGSEYPIAMFPKLANYIQEQFGEVNHFGGDGETMFAIPDLRNLFLRGYHGNSENELSGEIGEKQEATQNLRIYSGGTSDTKGAFYWYQQQKGTGVNFIENEDDTGKLMSSSYYSSIHGGMELLERTDDTYYTSRPVNAAVLYCIKT